MKITTQNIYPGQFNDDGDKFDFKSLFLKYTRLWPLFVGCITAALLIAFIVNQINPPVYKIQAKFLIEEDNNAMDVFSNTNAQSGKNAVFLKGQKVANESIVLKSRSIAEDALDHLDFDVEYFSEGLFSNKELYGSVPLDIEVDWSHPQLVNGEFKITWTANHYFKIDFVDSEYQRYTPGERRIIFSEAPMLEENEFKFGEWIELPDLRLLVNYTGAAGEGEMIVKVRDRESLVQEYTGDNLQIAPADKISSILLLTLDTHQPYKGRDYLNMLMKMFLEKELDEKNTIARNTISFIDSQLSGISDSLTYSGNKLETFRSQNRTYNITTEGNTLFEKLMELEKSLSQEKFKRDYYASLQQYLVGEKYADIIVPSGIGIDDPVLNGLISDLVKFQSERSRFLASQTENSPAVIEVTRKIKNLNQSVQEALKNLNRTSGLMIQDLSNRIARIEGQFGRLPQTEQDLLNIKRIYALNESIYTFLLQRRAESSISLASNAPANKVIEYAVLNLVPMKLKPLLNYFLAALLGLLIPMAVISLKEVFARKINDIHEVEQKLKIPVIGFVGKNKRPSPLVVVNHPRARISEAFRAIRANIDFLVPVNQQLSVLVTSSVAGEGKSFSAMNLASVYAACDKRTLIVRCDMHKSFSFDTLGAPNNLGLSNYLSGQTSIIDHVIQRTEYKNLDVLVSGPVPPNPAELLISDRFKHLLEGLKTIYDVIILDSSPVGLTNETLYLTRMVDLTLFVLRKNYSEKSFLGMINVLREKKKIKKLYALLNDLDDKDLNYQGYGYGYYEEEESENSFKKVIRTVTNKAAF